MVSLCSPSKYICGNLPCGFTHLRIAKLLSRNQTAVNGLAKSLANERPFNGAGRHEAPQPKQLHNRMPVFLKREDCARWAGSKHTPIDLLRPFPAEKMKVWHLGMTLAALGLQSESHPRCRMLLQTI